MPWQRMQKRIQAWNNLVSWEADLISRWKIRGAGDLLGGEQSGFINEIGFDTYQKNHERSYRRVERKWV
jgi:transcription-repair coupling factor (superfamily II helicase)